MAYTDFVHKRTQVQMMQDRGYIINPAELELISSFNSFKSNYSSAINYNLYIHKDPRRPNTHVLFYKPDNGKSYVELFKEYPRDHHIIIFDELPIITTDDIPKVSTELFEKRFFAINPIKHFLSDPITMLSPLETELFLAKTRFTLSKLAGISSKDVRVKYYGFPKGRVLREDRVERINVFNRFNTYYRVVRDVPILYETKGQKEEDADADADEDEEQEQEEYEEDELLETQEIDKELI